MSDISIDIIESTDIISQKILKALLPQVDSYFSNAFDKCQNKINTIVTEAISASPEYQSLLSGSLRYEFGLPDSESRLGTILSILNKITVKYTKPKITKNQIIGSFSLNMIQSDYADLLSSAAAILTTEKGSKLEWLKWLLLFGDKTIIKEYVVELGSNPRSRTGNAIMVSQTKGRWSVPPEFSGTQNNNWITRSIDSVNSLIEDVLTEALRG